MQALTLSYSCSDLFRVNNLWMDQVPWSAPGDAAAVAGATGPGTGAEDVVLPPQADSWMRAAVQQELMREQMQEQAAAQQYHQQQYAAAGGAGMPPQGMDMSQQPLLNAQVCAWGGGCADVGVCRVWSVRGVCCRHQRLMWWMCPGFYLFAWKCWWRAFTNIEGMSRHQVAARRCPH